MVAGAVIGALLVPLFVKPNTPVDNSGACAANMAQLGLAMQEYVQDNDGRWPSGRDHWAGQIFLYVKDTDAYHCPNDPVVGSPSAGEYACSYAMNANLLRHKTGDLTGASSTVELAEIDGTPLLDMTDAERSSLYTDGASPNSSWGNVALGKPGKSLAPTRHDPNVNFLACDGHIALLRPAQVSGGFDNRRASSAADGVHAAGAAALGQAYALTFSER
jgi:prepilin-type processing-associated H-X9-DG protein